MSAHRWMSRDNDDECMVCGATAVDGCSSEVPPCRGLNRSIDEVWAVGPNGVERVR